MLVTDAGALFAALADTGTVGQQARGRLEAEQVTAPALVDLEVCSALRGWVAAGRLSKEDAGLVVRDLGRLPLERRLHAPLLSRCWELRDNVTPYDAAYVALAEALDAPLLTTDIRLTRAIGPRCRFEVLA